jgi:hypothetical protein
VLSTWIDEVKGLSATTRQTVLQNLTVSRSELKEMNSDEIKRLLGIKPKEALLIAQFLNQAIDEED